MSTPRPDGATMRAESTLATSSASGISKSRISRGGMAPPQGLMRPSRSSSSTERPWRASVAAAVAPAGPPPTTTTSNSSMSFPLSLSARLRRQPHGAGPRRFGAVRLGVAHPRREDGGHEEHHRLAGEHRTVGGGRQAHEAAHHVHTHGAEEAARAEGHGLGGAPETHADPFPALPARRHQRHHRADGGHGEGAVGHAQREYAGPQRPLVGEEAARRQGHQGDGGGDAAADG